MKMIKTQIALAATLGITALTISGCGGGGGSSTPAVPVVSSLTLSSSLQQNLHDVPSAPSSGGVPITPPSAGIVNSIFSTSQINISHFTSTFDVQFTAGAVDGDGLTFCVQNSPPGPLTVEGGPLARGASGEGLGYQGLANSVAFKIDTHQNVGDPSADSVGVFTNGVLPVGGDDVSTVLNFHNGDVFHVVLVYDGTNLTATVTDYGPTGAGAVSGATFTKAYPVNIPAQCGSSVAYAGFTAASDTTSPQNIIDWTMTSGVSG